MKSLDEKVCVQTCAIIILHTFLLMRNSSLLRGMGRKNCEKSLCWGEWTKLVYEPSPHFSELVTIAAKWTWESYENSASVLNTQDVKKEVKEEFTVYSRMWEKVNWDLCEQSREPDLLGSPPGVPPCN